MGFRFSDLEIVRLENHHNISSFDCENRDLNEFLTNKSHFQMDHKMNVTYICKHDFKVVAYFTWCNDSIRIKKLQKQHRDALKNKGIDYEYLPALKLCRLAVDTDYQGNRIGPDLVELVIKNALRLSQKIGLRYITVDAYFQNKWLYDKYQFKVFPNEIGKIVKYKRNPRADHTIAMYLDII
jgi:hypothetical protein